VDLRSTGSMMARNSGFGIFRENNEFLGNIKHRQLSYSGIPLGNGRANRI
jgi:hypothetical protein